MEVEEGIVGCHKKVKVLFRGLSEIHLCCYNLFLQFIYKRRNKRLKTVVPMLSCGTLERRNSPYKEVIVEPCVSKSQSEIFATWI